MSKPACYCSKGCMKILQMLYEPLIWTDEEWLSFTQNNSVTQVQTQNSTSCFLKSLPGNFCFLKYCTWSPGCQSILFVVGWHSGNESLVNSSVKWWATWSLQGKVCSEDEEVLKAGWRLFTTDTETWSLVKQPRGLQLWIHHKESQ